MAEKSSSGDENERKDEKPLSSVVQNMAIAHEMVMDSNFRINEDPSDSLRGQIKQIVHNAFWDHFQEELVKEPPNYDPALRLLAELKETLLSVLFEHNTKLREQINNVLDMDLIRQQSCEGAVDIQGYAMYIIEVMSKICTPSRDEEIEKLKNVEGLVQLFREIFRVLDLMKLDMANFFLTQIRPKLAQQSVEFEQKQFREYLNGNPNGLESTKRWIVRGMNDMKVKKNEEQNSRNERTVVNELMEVHCGYIGILLDEEDYPYPETLLMDQRRMIELRHLAQCLVKLASVLVVTLNMVGRHLSSDSEFKKTLKENVNLLLKSTPVRQLENVFPNISEQVVKDTTSFLQKRGLPTLNNENTNSLRMQITNLAGKHSVCRLIKKRVECLLLSELLPSEYSASFPPALIEIQPELQELIKQFLHIVLHNFAVFQPFYKEIVAELNSEGIGT